ncbi:MAG: 6-carboxytetrahydropterin synthase QueD [Candidatus Gastranaerophilales bacterium]|nr:6-carboxytetrahydropterin synthase QueD [Candidatus Gastranaerophilales bacterium]
MFEVRVETNFSSAHHLLNYKGKCENMHGHNWKVEVTARGDKLDSSNILVDFKTLKRVVNEVMEYLDHKDLNELDEFKNESPSSEFIAKFIFYKVREQIKEVHCVNVWETPTSRASYFEIEE